MEEKNSDRLVATLEQSRLLMDYKYQDVIKNLWNGPASVSELAARLDTSQDQMYYRVQKLLKANLIFIDHELKRHGKSIKMYKTYSENYIVPFKNTKSVTVTDFFKEQLLLQQKEFLRYFSKHMEMASENSPLMREPYLIIEREGDKLALRTDFDDFDAGFSTSMWQKVCLTAKEAEELQKELKSLLDRYQGDITGEATYIIGLQLAEIIDEEA